MLAWLQTTIITTIITATTNINIHHGMVVYICAYTTYSYVYICLDISLMIFYLSVQDFSWICSEMINEHHPDTHTNLFRCSYIHNLYIYFITFKRWLCVGVGASTRAYNFKNSFYFWIWQKKIIFFNVKYLTLIRFYFSFFCSVLFSNDTGAHGLFLQCRKKAGGKKIV